MVRVDIHVGDTLQSVLLTQIFGGNAAVIEHAKPGGTIARRVMQSCDWHERALRFAAHDRVDGSKRGADNIGSRIEDSRQSRRIAVVEVSATLL